MKLFLFLDDWFLDSKVDIRRSFPQAKYHPLSQAHLLARSSIIQDEERGCYLALTKRGGVSSPLLYISNDGINWEESKDKLSFKPSLKSEKKNALFGTFPFEQTWFYDKWDKNRDRRYKMILMPFGPYPEAVLGPWPEAILGSYPKNGGIGLIAYSPDGLDWVIDLNHIWYKAPGGSDTTNNIFYNPFSRCWQIICRKQNADRRIAMVESTDLEDWTAPRIILQPDVLDPPLLQFYGMAAILYEGEYFIGLPQCFHVRTQEISNKWSDKIKMEGSVDAQLAYSYDGRYWLRANRSPIIARTKPGTYGCSCIYPHSIVISPDGEIFIYSIGTLTDHSVEDIPSGYPSREGLVLHTLRRDGFAYLEPVGGWGQFTTRCLIADSGELTVNYQAPLGKVLVQVTDSQRQPLSGYSFEECIPLKGDEIYGKVRWRQNPDLSGLSGKAIRLQFRLFDARVYAIRLNCKLCSGVEPTERI